MHPRMDRVRETTGGLPPSCRRACERRVRSHACACMHAACALHMHSMCVYAHAQHVCAHTLRTRCACLHTHSVCLCVAHAQSACGKFSREVLAREESWAQPNSDARVLVRVEKYFPRKWKYFPHKHQPNTNILHTNNRQLTIKDLENRASVR